MYGKPSYISLTKLRYDSLSQKYQDKSCQVLGVLMASILVFILFAELLCRASLIMRPQRANYQELICIFFDFSLTVKAAPHECVIRTNVFPGFK